MIPILFDGNSAEFKSNGLGRLSDCISCQVTEERNGVFECEFVYPITGAHYAEIDLGKIIIVTHDDRKRKQPFVIYRRSAPISGQVVFNAHHISYNLSNVIIKPFSASTITAAFSGFGTYAMNANMFTFWTDKTSSGTFTVEAPTPCRALLAGQEGSILDAFGGGDYEFDNYTVKLYANRGIDTGVTIRYGKNLIDLEAETDTMKLYTAVVPYWKNGDEIVYGNIVFGSGAIRRTAEWTDENGVVITDENGEAISFSYGEHKVTTMDLSSYFDEAPMIAQLESRALTVLNSNAPWGPTVNVKVDFAALWQTEEYKNIAPLQRVRLCDTVTVQYAELGVDVKARIIQTVWNPLLDRYDSIQIGDARTSFADVITADTDAKLADVPNNSMMQAAIDHATEMITGTNGGNIRFNLNANGQPFEQLIMDSPDIATAVNVWRWNLGGLGHSHNGYSGPFDDVAITQDGQINASMITVGLMSFNRLRGGTITLGGSGIGNGTLELYDESDNMIGTFDNTGVNITKGSFTTSSGIYKSSISGGSTLYYNDDELVGFIGTNTWVNHPEYKGLSFDLEEDGSYMGFFSEETVSGVKSFYAKLIYAKENIGDIASDTLRLGCNFDCGSNAIIDPTWYVNGAKAWGVTNKANFVAITQMASDGKAANWSNGCSLTFSNGILIAGVMPWEN